MAEARVCVAAIAGAHGVRGLVKIKPFTEVAEDVAAYGPLSDEAGKRHFDLELKGQVKGLLLAKIGGVTDRDVAQALRGTRLYVARSALPEPVEDETYYHADLIGLRVETESGEVLGRVQAVYDFGAGDVLEVKAEGGADFFLPFTKAQVPLVDVANGRLVAMPVVESEEDEAMPVDESEEGTKCVERGA